MNLSILAEIWTVTAGKMTGNPYHNLSGNQMLCEAATKLSPGNVDEIEPLFLPGVL
jgi:hypothetical protein